jgi:hypothetical protein
MHPSRDHLIDYAVGRLEGEARLQVSRHIDKCEFCREFYDNYKLYEQALADATREKFPSKIASLAERLYAEAFSGKIIRLEPLGFGSAPAFHLAADGPENKTPDIISLGDFYSENPEMVLRVMRDQIQSVDYIQLIAVDSELASNVLVQIPDINQELLTDNTGRALLPPLDISSFKDLKWQVKLPDATFLLKSLDYNPDAVEYKKEMTLETEKNDKILVSFEGKTEGKQISLQVLQLDGNPDFGPVRVSVAQKTKITLKQLSPKEKFAFDLTEPDSEIIIRLFQ